MPITQTDGLIIKEQKVGENDRLITIITRELGIVRAFASNALKLKSKNITSTQLLSYSRLSIYHGRDTYKINDARSIRIFMELRSNIEHLALSGYFCELLNFHAPIAEQADEYLRLMLNCLHFLGENKISPLIIKAIFELKLCQFIGYMPSLTKCHTCKEDISENANFDLSNGVIYCENCGIGYCLPNSVLAAMRHIIYGDEKKLFAFQLSDESATILSDVCEKFLQTQTERTYKTLEFYHSIRI